MSILIIAEHDNLALSSATLSVVSAALSIGGEIDVVVAGSNSSAVAKQAASISGVRKIFHSDAPHYAWPLAENVAPLIASIGKNYTHIMAASSTTGKDIMPRAAALLDTIQISDITEILSGDSFKRPIYAGNAIETVQSAASPLVITVRQSAFGAAKINSDSQSASAAIEALAPLADSGLSEFVSLQASKSERPELASARTVISGGRGIGSAENFKFIEQLADKLGAAIGASRAAVDAGFVPNDYQVGQTGKIVAPDLYIAVAISGAIQHLAGMKDSKIIVAINKDENAPIFEVADYGLVGEWENILPELTALI